MKKTYNHSNVLTTLNQAHTLSGLLYLVLFCLISCTPTSDPSQEGVNKKMPLEISTKEEQLKLIDSHVHLTPTAIPVMLQLMNDNNIAKVINLSCGHQDKTVEIWAEIMRFFPERIFCLYNPDLSRINEPGIGDIYASELSYAVERGYVGVYVGQELGLTLRTQNGNLLTVDDERLFPLWKQAAALKVPVALATGAPKTFWEPFDEQNDRYQELRLRPDQRFFGRKIPSKKQLLQARDRLLSNFPQTTFIGIFFGNSPEDLYYLKTTLETYPNFYIDIAARVSELGLNDPKEVQIFFQTFRTRILFGTNLSLSENLLTLGSLSENPSKLTQVPRFYTQHLDYLTKKNELIHHPIPIQGVHKVRSLALSDDILRDITYRNAERLFVRTTRLF